MEHHTELKNTFQPKKKVLIIQGPNLNLLGKRQTKFYGTSSLEEIQLNLTKMAPLNYEVTHFQDNCEGKIVDFLNNNYLMHYEGKEKIAGIIINPGAYTHTSIAIRDALEVFYEAGVKIYEVHLSNIFKRESFRHISYISTLAEAVICGLGANGYEVALNRICEIKK